MIEKIRYPLIMFVSLFATSATAGPMAYGVNSDSINPTMDSLYLIDLATGIDQQRGHLFTGIEYRTDTEGLAFNKNHVLYGIDDGTSLASNGYPTLFPINPVSGSIGYNNEIVLNSLPPGGGNDFGMTFSCDDSLYVTTVSTKSLYKVDVTDGSTEIKGATGALGVNISAIAAIGNPTKLYGLGNGQLMNGSEDSPNLYSIDVNTGVATMIGPLGLVGDITSYNEAGLAFDSDGNLWAITDRSAIGNQSSQILRIDTATGAATFVSNTGEMGYESLAIASPVQCDGVTDGSGDRAPPIPTLNPAGRLFAIFFLMFAGMTILRKRNF